MSWVNLREIANLASGVAHGEDVLIESVSIDSRTLKPGALYIAVRGERHDGHDFVAAAAAAGAAAVMVAKPADAPLPQIRVDDTLKAMTRLAGKWRRRMRALIIGVTGSNGKTTTREMLASILSRNNRTVASAGNLNNHIGVPLTLLSLRPEHEIGVVEMGANHPGEISRLCEIARPDIGVVLNAAPAHIEGFGSLDGVARAKGELFESLPRAGAGVINRDDAYCDYWRHLLTGRRVLSFGFSDQADFRARLRDDGGAECLFDGAARECRLQLPGKHNIMNALAAAAAAHAAGVAGDDIVAGLEAVRPVAGRLQSLPGVNGLHLIDDTYNANPGSLAAALDVLAECPGKRWLALGDMAELGPESAAMHADAGSRAKTAGVARLFAVGGEAAEACARFGDGAERFPSVEALAAAIAEQAADDVYLLVKGSRAARMERLVAALRPAAAEMPQC